MKYTAIDFETADKKPASACAVGIVTGDGRKIIKETYHLMRPPRMVFDDDCIRVNQIHPADVENEPEFPAFWEELAEALDGSIVFAHNAPFDMGVLSAMMDWYDIPDIHFQWGCTVKLSRVLWKDMPNHRLNTVAGMLGFSFHHHQALDDARACEFIVRKAMEKTGSRTLDGMMGAAGQIWHPFTVRRTPKAVSLF
ncbi:MAG TPA: exonuclease [Veillonellaceae bacterium]|jgi:DNA polymerase-3 subunit epsilon|nr:exonuclease [Veillonellaceae bacterium]